MDGACPQDGLEGLLRNNGPCGRGWEEKRTTGLTFLRRRPQGGEDRTVGAVETVPAVHGQPSGLRSSLGLPRHPLVVTRVLASRWQARVWGRSPSWSRAPWPVAGRRGCGDAAPSRRGVGCCLRCSEAALRGAALEATLVLVFAPGPASRTAHRLPQAPCWSPEAPSHNRSPRACWGTPS